MIIEPLLQVLFNLLSAIFGSFNIPSASPSFESSLQTFIDALDYAKTFLPLVLPVNVVPYLVIAIGLFAFEKGYKPVMFIINKITNLL